MRATLRQRDSHARGETATAACAVLKFKQKKAIMKQQQQKNHEIVQL